MPGAASIPEIAALADGADHVDVKTVACDKDLDRFAADFLSYSPGWINALVRLYGVLGRVMGLPHEAHGEGRASCDVPFQPGDRVSFFTVREIKPGRYWIGEALDKHLSCHLAMYTGTDDAGRSLRHVATIVHFRRWTGRVYFNLIRPFHHLIAGASARYAAKG
jgi:hypothetical protein